MIKLINPVEVVIKEKKKRYIGVVKQLTLYAKVKVIAVETDSSEQFYLVFYDDSFIYGNKLHTIEDESFIDHASKQGITYDQNHPLTSALVPTNSVNIPSKTSIFTNLQTHYSLKEVAYIATMLDSFFSKEELIKMIDKIFYHFRVNGNFLEAFQIIQLLLHFEPSLKSAQARIRNSEYDTYDELYNSYSLSSIYKKDPLYVEFYCFKNRFDSSSYAFLEDHLIKEKRHMEAVCLWLEKATNETAHESSSIETYTNMALTFIPFKQWITILSNIDVNIFRVLPGAKHIVEDMITDAQYDEAILCLLPFIQELPDTYDELLMKLWSQLNPVIMESHINDFITLIERFIKSKGLKESEQLISQLVEKLFLENDLQTVNDLLVPIRLLAPNSLTIQKILHMIQISENPDRMMELGEYFADFKKLDEAIECFFWEMELYPENPEPVWRLKQMYQDKGMTDEAKGYQQLYTQLKAN
ncbi:hypothetical protein QGM71_10385 [Virgibacillus sp. C22-A2]|uniref:Tetratricopeptide repeat protein n=1 Tax=Virgibacillus tibetensis TaxID=3042313 RepID=A0ABU6KEZ9_9BACI|nr:hypothetical protein [Virgibacillus sp. C22-A2]